MMYSLKKKEKRKKTLMNEQIMKMRSILYVNPPFNYYFLHDTFNLDRKRNFVLNHFIIPLIMCQLMISREIYFKNSEKIKKNHVFFLKINCSEHKF